MILTNIGVALSQYMRSLQQAVWCRELQEKYGAASFGSYGTGHRDSIESVSMLPPEQSAAIAVLSQQTLTSSGDLPLVWSMP